MSKWEDWNFGQKAAVIVGGAIVGLGFAVLFGFVMMWLWNGLMPRIFHLPTIGYWEGWGLVILSSILFKGSTGRSGGHGQRRKKRMLRERMRQGDEEMDGATEGSEA